MTTIKTYYMNNWLEMKQIIQLFSFANTFEVFILFLIFHTPPTHGWARISSGLKPDLPLCPVSLWKRVLALSESQMYNIMREGGCT